ncbi:MAG: hypothetical protein PWP23_558 [Candidatus Sumerlaeota bacterium]|nr:hypothetical protein [Candidatus Sumerlaeota bacterium]
MMRMISAGRMAAAFFCTCWLALAASTNAQATAQSWYRTWANGEEARRRLQKPVFLYFYSPNARPCKEIQEKTFPDPEIAQLMEQFVLVALHEPHNRELSRKFSLIKVPTIVFLDPDGQKVEAAVGFKDPETLKQYLDAVLEKTNTGREKTRAIAARNVLASGATTTPVKLRLAAPLASRVCVVGDFNDWRDGMTPMLRNSAGIWEVTVHLPQGVYEYKFLLDSETYKQDEMNPLRKANPYGNMNSVIALGNVRWSPIVQGNDVTFLIYDEEATEVAIAGNFNNWQPQQLFKKPNDRGMWGARITLPPGQYAYKFIVDGEWKADPENFWPVQDENGNMNSSFVVR